MLFFYQKPNHPSSSLSLSLSLSLSPSLTFLLLPSAYHKPNHSSFSAALSLSLFLAYHPPMSTPTSRLELGHCTEELGCESSSNLCGLTGPPPVPECALVLSHVDLHNNNNCHHGHSGSRRAFTRARTFPPPIFARRPFLRASKSNGRFVLQCVEESNMSSISFLVIREGGRLRLDLHYLTS